MSDPRLVAKMARIIRERNRYLFGSGGNPMLQRNVSFAPHYRGIVTHSYEGPDYGPKHKYPNQVKQGPRR